MSQRRLSSLRHKLFCRLTDFDRQNSLDVDINRDPLHRLYAVNRHGICVSHSKREPVVTIRGLLVKSLLDEGWTLSHTHGFDVFTTDYEGSKMSIWMYQISTGGHSSFSLTPAI